MNSLLHTSPDKVRTRQRILTLLKQDGPMDAQSLAAQLSLVPMSVREHLYDLQKQGLVNYREEARPMGRPAKLWHLLPAADRFFADGHAALSVELLKAVSDTVGPQGITQVLTALQQRQITTYMSRMPKGGSLHRRLEALAALRTAEGYMAEIQVMDDGTYLLIENHCPIRAAAYAEPGLCKMEAEVLRQVLGQDAEMERTEHIITGERRCAYRVRASHGVVCTKRKAHT